VQDGDDGVHGDGEGSGSGDLLVLPAHALAVVQDEPAELVARLDALLQLGRLDRGGQVDLPEGQAPQDDAGDAEVHGPADVRLTVLVGAQCRRPDAKWFFMAHAQQLEFNLYKRVGCQQSGALYPPGHKNIRNKAEDRK